MDSEEFLKQVEKMKQNFKQSIEQDIREHKQHGLDIFYSENGILIMEKPDGTKYEYEMINDEPVIVREIK
ncbi:MAG: hypothetical protein HC836_10440 [Richelia sp. RM2_1_2]|nr:hypothetical protein [Richelia sp. SM2_1_7]NJM17358.1 hypothetical protein [Richelia sp. SM1_7_0]NJN09473.1 hypothetical protein [Richelia sp. RM1_1_1]NJO26868.1 hypothetical protein [Richelia sp. SL_2_1]NJO58738.1 hypothetical protein [Richelia sp. RM2_1_2]